MPTASSSKLSHSNAVAHASLGIVGSPLPLDAVALPSPSPLVIAELLALDSVPVTLVDPVAPLVVSDVGLSVVDDVLGCVPALVSPALVTAFVAPLFVEVMGVADDPVEEAAPVIGELDVGPVVVG